MRRRHEAKPSMAAAAKEIAAPLTLKAAVETRNHCKSVNLNEFNCSAVERFGEKPLLHKVLQLRDPLRKPTLQLPFLGSSLPNRITRWLNWCSACPVRGDHLGTLE